MEKASRKYSTTRLRGKTPPDNEIIEPEPICEVDFSRHSFANFTTGFFYTPNVPLTGTPLFGASVLSGGLGNTV
jgi:hypothetical protein